MKSFLEPFYILRINGLGNNAFVGAFSAVNESTWEHLKLAFFPMLVTTIIGLFFTNINIKCYLRSRLCAIITAITFITVFFYTYTGIIGTNIAIIDISSFVVAIVLGEFVFYKLIKNQKDCNIIFSNTILVALLLAFIMFTYFPPKIQYFKDPITDTYGIIKSNKH